MPQDEAFAWNVRVVADRDASATVFARRHRLEIGPALSFDAEEPRLTALEHVLAAIGADLVTGVMRLARRRRVGIDAAEASVQARLDNPLTWLDVVGEKGNPGLKRVGVRVYLTTSAPAATIQLLWDDLLAASPLVNTFRDCIDLDLSFKTTL